MRDVTRKTFLTFGTGRGPVLIDRFRWETESGSSRLNSPVMLLSGAVFPLEVPYRHKTTPPSMFCSQVFHKHRIVVYM